MSGYSNEEEATPEDNVPPVGPTITKIVPNSFVCFEPKDIVSGDFYWIKETTTSYKNKPNKNKANKKYKKTNRPDDSDRRGHTKNKQNGCDNSTRYTAARV